MFLGTLGRGDGVAVGEPLGLLGWGDGVAAGEPLGLLGWGDRVAVGERSVVRDVRPEMAFVIIFTNK